MRFTVLLSYLRRPMFYGTLNQIIRRKLLRSIGAATDTREEATSWCARLAVDEATAVKMLTSGADIRNLERLFPKELDFANEMVASCPTPMGGGANLSLIFALCESVGAVTAVETGVAYGWSSLAILLSLRNRKGRLISTDMPYPELNNDRYVGCVVPSELRPMWRIFRSPDRKALRLALSEMPEIDICHYDSDKSYEGRSWAYGLLWDALRPEGIFMSDDIGDNLAFHDFCLSVRVDPIIVGYDGKYCGVMVKPSI